MTTPRHQQPTITSFRQGRKLTRLLGATFLLTLANFVFISVYIAPLPLSPRADDAPLLHHRATSHHSTRQTDHPRRMTGPTHSDDKTTKCPGPEVTIEFEGGRKVLEKIRAGVLQSQKALARAQNDGVNEKVSKIPRILCIVYTHSQAHDRLKAISKTWGGRCDSLIGASNLTDPSISALNIPHQGPEAYGNMWQKVRSIWAHVIKHHLHDFDYFHLCGDDVFLFVDNLRVYLMSDQIKQKEQGTAGDDIFEQSARRRGLLNGNVTKHWPSKGNKKPLLLGMPHCAHTPSQATFPDGGPGYTVNRPALDLFAQQGLNTFESKSTDSREDVFMGGFFAKHGIWTTDTRDETGAWRYGGNGDAQASYLYDGIQGSAVNPERLARRFDGYSYPPSLQGVSEQTVSLHLKNVGKRFHINKSIPDLIYRYEEIVYRSESCDTSTVDNDHRPTQRGKRFSNF